MADMYTIELEWADVMQVLDALESRATSWENTLAYARGEDVDPEAGPVEEHSNEGEAEAIATHFRDIIHKLELQLNRA